jgi:hypothetical protein
MSTDSQHLRNKNKVCIIKALVSVIAIGNLILLLSSCHVGFDFWLQIYAVSITIRIVVSENTGTQEA